MAESRLHPTNEIRPCRPAPPPPPRAPAYTATLLAASRHSRFLLGAGGGGLNTAANALVADLYAEDRGAMLNLLGTFFGFGALFIPQALGFVDTSGPALMSTQWPEHELVVAVPKDAGFESNPKSKIQNPKSVSDRRRTSIKEEVQRVENIQHVDRAIAIGVASSHRSGLLERYRLPTERFFIEMSNLSGPSCSAGL